MAGGKETPRQKMIGMMYLVLTALLALNVSKEILDAFITINNGLETTKLTFNDKLSGQYGAFAASFNENPAKYGDAWTKAQTLQTEANNMVAHIDLIKAKIIAETEGLAMEEVIGPLGPGKDTILNLRYVRMKDNYNVNTNIMVGGEAAKPKTDDHPDGNNYRAAVLKQKLQAYGATVREMVKEQPALAQAIDSLFNYPENVRDASGTMVKWEALNFVDVPLAATVTILSKFQTDVRNAESDALGYLFADVDAASYKFTKLVPIVQYDKTYVLEGDSLRASVFLAAYDETNFPEISLAPEGMKLDSAAKEIPGDKARTVPIGPDGRGQLRIPANSVGEKSWEGIIKFRNPAGQGYNSYTYKVEYEVARPSLVVSPTKMNVLYRGIDNPVAISVPGISQDALRPSITSGQLVKQSDGSYIVRGVTGSKATVSVSAEMDGKMKPMGSFDFRVKSVPDPVAKFAGKYSSDNSAQKSDLTAALGVFAELKDFEFELSYPIRSFDLTVIMGGDVKTITSNSNRMTEDQKSLLQQVRRNQTVIIENIKATAPDGTIRALGSINLRVI